MTAFESDSPGDASGAMFTGGGVIGVKYKGGVLLAVDTQIAFGHGKRCPSNARIVPIGSQTVVAAAGDHAQLQGLSDTLTRMHKESKMSGVESEKTSSEMHSYVSRLLYHQRTKMNPMWLNVVVAGIVDEKPYLGFTDMYGTATQHNFVCNGYSTYFSIPHLRDEAHEDMTLTEAQDLIIRCFRIQSGVECASSQQIQISQVTNNGIIIHPPEFVTPHWDAQSHVSQW